MLSNQIKRATPDDTMGIYVLLHDAHFFNLPHYSAAKPILEKAHALIVKLDGRVVLWASYHGQAETYLDLVIAPDVPRNILTKGLCEYVLAYGLKLSQDGFIKVKAYNPKGVKACLSMGFKIDTGCDENGWVGLVLTKEEFERKFVMRGKSIRA